VENPTAGVRINWVLRDGGNNYNGMFFTTYGNHALQGNNLTSELQAQGLKVKITYTDVTDPNSDQIVLDQNPEGGQQIKPGSQVTLVVGRCPQGGCPAATTTTTTP